MLEIFYVLITLNLEKIIPFYNTYLLNLKSFCYLCVCFWLKSLWFVAVHGVWEEWSPWSLCSFTCGRGQRTRTRSCIPPQYGGRSCDGPETQHKPCNIALCPGELIKQLYALLWCIQCELFVISFIILCAHTQIKKKKKKKDIQRSRRGNFTSNFDYSGPKDHYRSHTALFNSGEQSILQHLFL